MKGITMKKVTIEIADGGRVLFDGIPSNYRWACGIKAVKLSPSKRKQLGDYDTTVWYDKGIESTIVVNYHSESSQFSKILEIAMIRDIYVHYIHRKAQSEILKIK